MLSNNDPSLVDVVYSSGDVTMDVHLSNNDKITNEHIKENPSNKP